jgi:hypothetical protein
MSARVAETSLILSGGAITLLHLFLRTNVSKTAIRPRATPWNGRRKLRIFGPNELEVLNISPPLNLVPNYRADEKVTEVHARYQKHIKGKETLTPWTPRTPIPQSATTLRTAEGIPKSLWPLPEEQMLSPRTPVPPTPPVASHRSPSHKNRPSYSLFPEPESSLTLPATTYSPPTAHRPVLHVDTSLGSQLSHRTVDPFHSSPPIATKSAAHPAMQNQLLAPAAPWAALQRPVSIASSTGTLQIGIRLSAAPTVLGAQSRPSSMPPPPPRKNSLPKDDLPLTAGANAFSAPGKKAVVVAQPNIVAGQQYSSLQALPVSDANGRNLTSFIWAPEPEEAQASSSLLRPINALRKMSNTNQSTRSVSVYSESPNERKTKNTGGWF